MVLFCVSMGIMVIAMLLGVAITANKNMFLSESLERQNVATETMRRELNRRSISATISKQEAAYYKAEA